ncbi:hypothetical protein [Hymenobacter jeollabukensis]|uniref:Uncharacterized protein n=1 Tax=Hymenobacter jeollabukensis TaxID=2025313 RepID=A0A5R8WVI3_9BACT|nr:hypothetical protein [Hymenobacter jeollabukensis]TLM96530.1 hypothetical protein FDY95_00605 [Hymenobacter jeollabukensis]
MAIWQYRLTALPAAGIRRRCGHVPSQLFIDHEGWKQYWNALPSADSPPKPVIDDAYTTDWWEGLGVAVAPIAARIDQLIQRAAWSSQENWSWKGKEENQQDHDCWISVRPNAQTIDKFQFRTDLRDINTAAAFLLPMLGICEQYDLLVLDTRGQLMQPNLAAVYPSIKESSAVRFLTNPQAFLEQVLREQKGA